MIENPWIGQTPEEFNHPNKKEYTISFTMRGTITVYADDIDDARESFGNLGNIDLIDYVDDIDIDSID